MKSYSPRYPRLLIMCFALMRCFGTFNAYGLTEGDYTYTVTNGMATINGFNTSFSGTLIVADTLGGCPVTSLGDGSFSGCDGLTAVTIPAGVSNIGNWVFSGCIGLAGVNMPATVTNVGAGAFSDCKNLTEISFPPGVTNIEDFMFYGCDSLASITILPNVVGIGKYAFFECIALTNLIVSHGVVNIKNWAFSGCDGLTSVTMPSSMTNIGDWAFSYCNGLTNAVINGNAASIGEFAFSDCIRLTSVTLGVGIIDIGGFSFYGCKELNSVAIKGDGANVGEHAFGDCVSLVHLTIYEGVASIGRLSFYRCTGLTSVLIPSSVTNIGEAAFNSCDNLVGVTILPGVTSIGESAFNSCRSLANITIPSSMTVIGDRAFVGCNNLSAVCFWGNAPSIGSCLFDGTIATIYYRAGKTDWTNPWADRPSVCDARVFCPIIIQQPADQSAVAGFPASFSVLVTSEIAMTYQWRKGLSNITGATNATLTIDIASAYDSGKYSVRVYNAYGSVASVDAKLTILGGDQYSQEAIRMPDPIQMQKDSEQDSLVVITHGFQPDGADADVDWVLEMAADISAFLASEGKTNWRVNPYCWQEWAGPTPESALIHGEERGAILGLQIGAQHWQHVHLIAHSAGAALIQAAIERIHLLSPETTIHATFLDPFAGYTTINRLVYGHHANWSDNYFTRDRQTIYTTNSRLIYAHNIDVTQLDPKYSGGSLLCFYSNSTMPVSTPALAGGSRQDSEHSWPHAFYASTITNGVPSSEGYGFPLSKEAGKWDILDNYERNNNPRKLGDLTLTCLPDTTITTVASTFPDFSSLPQTASATGAIVLPGIGIQLTCTSASPLAAAQMSQGIKLLSETSNTAWLSAAVTVTGDVNFVSCDIAFTSPADAQGLLTVYWETNVIATVDERAVLTGSGRYRFPLADTFPAGTYALGFRLDSFTNITSSVTVTNVAAGFAGDASPMSLDVSNEDEGMIMTLSGPSQYNYLVEASTNLVDWAPFAILANTNGTVRFYDPEAANYPTRFYRAVKP